MWLRLWSYARIEMGLSKAEFLRLNWPQWDALRKRREEQREAADAMLEYMTAQLIAMVGNTGFKGWKEPRKPEEFMPSRLRRRAAAESRPKTKRQQAIEFSRAMDRAMRQAEAYQRGQVSRGIN